MKMRQTGTYRATFTQVQNPARRIDDLAGNLPFLVLPGQSGRKPAIQNTLIYGLYRLGYHSRASVHAFRATASTNS